MVVVYTFCTFWAAGGHLQRCAQPPGTLWAHERGKYGLTFRKQTNFRYAKPRRIIETKCVITAAFRNVTLQKKR